MEFNNISLLAKSALIFVLIYTYVPLVLSDTKDEDQSAIDNNNIVMNHGVGQSDIRNRVNSVNSNNNIVMNRDVGQSETNRANTINDNNIAKNNDHRGDVIYDNRSLRLRMFEHKQNNTQVDVNRGCTHPGGLCTISKDCCGRCRCVYVPAPAHCSGNC